MNDGVKKRTGYWLRFYALLNTKWVILEMFPKPKLISWLGMEKQNLTQQKHITN